MAAATEVVALAAPDVTATGSGSTVSVAAATAACSACASGSSVVESSGPDLHLDLTAGPLASLAAHVGGARSSLGSGARLFHSLAYVAEAVVLAVATGHSGRSSCPAASGISAAYVRRKGYADHDGEK